MGSPSSAFNRAPAWCFGGHGFDFQCVQKHSDGAFTAPSVLAHGSPVREGMDDPHLNFKPCHVAISEGSHVTVEIS